MNCLKKAGIVLITFCAIMFCFSTEQVYASNKKQTISIDMEKTSPEKFVSKVHSYGKKGLKNHTTYSIRILLKGKNSDRWDQELYKYARKVQKASNNTYQLSMGINDAGYDGYGWNDKKKKYYAELPFTANDILYAERIVHDAITSNNGVGIGLFYPVEGRSHETQMHETNLHAIGFNTKMYCSLSDAAKFYCVGEHLGNTFQYDIKARYGEGFQWENYGNKKRFRGVCIHYAQMYAQLVRMLFVDYDYEVVINQQKKFVDENGAGHALAILKVKNAKGKWEYLEGNNNTIVYLDEYSGVKGRFNLCYLDWVKDWPKLYKATALEKQAVAWSKGKYRIKDWQQFIIDHCVSCNSVPLTTCKKGDKYYAYNDEVDSLNKIYDRHAIEFYYKKGYTFEFYVVSQKDGKKYKDVKQLRKKGGATLVDTKRSNYEYKANFDIKESDLKRANQYLYVIIRSQTDDQPLVFMRTSRSLANDKYLEFKVLKTWKKSKKDDTSVDPSAFHLYASKSVLGGNNEFMDYDAKYKSTCEAYLFLVSDEEAEEGKYDENYKNLLKQYSGELGGHQIRVGTRIDGGALGYSKEWIELQKWSLYVIVADDSKVLMYFKSDPIQYVEGEVNLHLLKCNYDAYTKK